MSYNIETERAIGTVVIPAEAGIQAFLNGILDSRLRGNEGSTSPPARLCSLNPGPGKGLIFSLAVLCLMFNSCATERMLPRETPPVEGRAIEGKPQGRAEGMRWLFPVEKYFRIYSMNFSSFHPKLNSALQEYARKNKGNSFRVVRLGSDGVIIKGYFRSDRKQERLAAEMAVTPDGKTRTRLEIKLSDPDGKMDGDSLDKAYQELFGIIERGTGAGPPA